MSAQVTGSTRRTPTQEVLTEFILALVQSFLRTGYYLPDHPQSKKAKAGLYHQFQSLFAGRHELTFMLKQMGEVTRILVDGPVPETQSLDALMTRGMAEIYVPRLAKFLERKDLVSLTLKEGMDEKEFSSFIDVMSEPSLTTRDATGKRAFVDRLRESGISNISFVFNEDLIVVERDLPWRVQLSISRLRKDLKLIPLFQSLDDEGVRGLRKQVIRDVLRPIREPDLMAAILLNSDLAGTSEMSEEELEDEVVHFIPDDRLVAVGREALRVHESTTDSREMASTKRAMVKLYRRLHSCEADGKEELIRQLLDRRLIEFKSLPDDLREQITIEHETDRFLQNPAETLGALEASPSAELYRTRAEELVRVIGELTRRHLLDDVLITITNLRAHAELDDFRASAAGDALQAIGNGSIGAGLKDAYLHGKKEDRVVLATIFQSLGIHGVLQLIDVILETEDTWIRKNASEVLLRLGEEAERLLLAALCSGELSDRAVAEISMVFGEVECRSETVLRLLHRYVEHEEARIREEAAWALCRIQGKEGEALFLRLLDDPALEVRKRAIRCLRYIKSDAGLPRFIEILRRAREEPDLEPLETQVYQALAEFPDAEIEPGVKTEPFLVTLLEESYPKGLRAMLHRGAERRLSGGALLAICDTLDVIGTNESIPILEDLSRRAQEPVRQRLRRAIEHIASRARVEAPAEPRR